MHLKAIQVFLCIANTGDSLHKAALALPEAQAAGFVQMPGNSIAGRVEGGSSFLGFTRR